MQRFFAGLTLIPALAMFVGLTGCGKEEKPTKPSRPPIVTGDGGGGGSGAAKKKIAVGTAKLVGKVVFEGELPKIDSLEPTMLENKQDGKFCCSATNPNEKIDQTWLVGKDKGVANVVIWVNPPDGSEFEVKEDKSNAVLDQPHCVYVPHVLVVKPGQKLVIKNSADVAHNTKLDVDSFVNKPFGQTIPPKKEANPIDLNFQEKAITAACDFHGWMKAKIWVSPHQFVAVTKEDGTFVIEGLPEGEFSVVAWHESPGYFHGGKKGTKTTIKGGENKIDLKVSAK